MKTNYKDVNGNTINYGDILRWLDFPCRQGENYISEPYMMIVPYNSDRVKRDCMMYMSAMDEYTPISEWQTKEDEKDNKISCVKIFVDREAYEANLKYFDEE